MCLKNMIYSCNDDFSVNKSFSIHYNMHICAYYCISFPFMLKIVVLLNVFDNLSTIAPNY